MSLKVVKSDQFPQLPFQNKEYEHGSDPLEELPVIAGLLSDLKHAWYAKGPYLEIRSLSTRLKIVSWIFGRPNELNTRICAIDEIKGNDDDTYWLIIAVNSLSDGGLIYIFDVFNSMILRTIKIGETISSMHCLDSGCDGQNIPEDSVLKYFDGVLSVGTVGGNVYLVDLCQQVFDSANAQIEANETNNSNPCLMVVLPRHKFDSIKEVVEMSLHNKEHISIVLNEVIDSSTEHFILKGENDENRVFVNRSETEVSSLFYASQMGLLLVGYNFGAFQAWNMRTLKIMYTSSICEGNIPISHFAVQEPADDPRAYCYVWVTYSYNLIFRMGMPFAVMHSFYFKNKKPAAKFGNICYESFQHCSVRLHMELEGASSSKKGGSCLGLQSINKEFVSKNNNSLALCLSSWLVWHQNGDIYTEFILFDLNQWYKEQMPRTVNWANCSNYAIKNRFEEQMLQLKIDERSIHQFVGIQPLEEHFCPTSLSFDLWGITEDSIIKAQNLGVQKFFLGEMVNDTHLALVKPDNYYLQVVHLGLLPLFCETHFNTSQDIDYQRNILLSVALEQKLIGWICKATNKMIHNAFQSAGLTIYNVLEWASRRAIMLKSYCDKFCEPLFDFSKTKLDENIIAQISAGTVQIKSLCSVYRHIIINHGISLVNREELIAWHASLENVVLYFEVLVWMINIGLLPEAAVETGNDLMHTPYLVDDLTEFYNKKRIQLKMASQQSFMEKDCLLFVDNLIDSKGLANALHQQWQKDGGTGLYPPPSLQSLLRSYLIDGPDGAVKHSLVTYTLMDIAMTAGDNNKIIKFLLKFPQIFNISQSVIKIVQAFWHLDHDDYETALASVLDPCVLSEDLEPWHHSMMMRSLLIQDQASLALLYLKIRKPMIEDNSDLFTVVSLLISKNMLNEAFKFRFEHKGSKDDTLLIHIFNECSKNELLDSLLYRDLSDEEEKAFLEYLQDSGKKKYEDMKVFYYLLRSRFLEAFDTHSVSKRKRQGMTHQNADSAADNIVEMYKTLLPEVNRNLLELVAKERSGLWRKIVPKPTPLSVFVHNTEAQVQYKSSVIFASLAKAKETFNDSLSKSRGGRGEVTTEETPFLRTPLMVKSVSQMDTSLLRTKIIEHYDEEEQHEGPSPAKRLKLSSRASTASYGNLEGSLRKELDSPIVKRRQHIQGSATAPVRPPSILKSTNLLLDDSVFEHSTSVNTSLQLEHENSVRRSKLELSSRRSIRTPNKSHVKFVDLRYSSSPTEQNSSSTMASETSKTSSHNTSEESFYSPENSIEKMEDNINEEPSLRPAIEKPNVASTPVPVGENDLSTNRLNYQSPKARRSYKRSFDSGDATTTPTRFSPRLVQKPTASSSSSNDNSIGASSKKVRKSLARSVLEHNAFNTLRVGFNLCGDVNESEINSERERKEDDTKNNVVESPSTPAAAAVPKDSPKLLSCRKSIREVSADVHLESGFESHRSSTSERDLSAILNKYKKHDDVSLNESSKDMLQEDLASKTTEIRTTTIFKENIRQRGYLISSRESKDEYFSKSECINDEKEEQPMEVDLNISDEVRNAETLSEEKDNHLQESNKIASVPDISGEESNEEINVYEDLSSGSEELNDVLNSAKLHQESVYSFNNAAESNEEEMVDNHSVIEESNFNNDYHEDQLENEALVTSQTVIEISSDSSSDGSKSSSSNTSEDSYRSLSVAEQQLSPDASSNSESDQEIAEPAPLDKPIDPFEEDTCDNRQSYHSFGGAEREKEEETPRLEDSSDVLQEASTTQCVSVTEPGEETDHSNGQAQTPKNVIAESVVDSVLKLKTVQKIYPGPRASTFLVNLDVTPKLATHLTRKTYTRKLTNSEESVESASAKDEAVGATDAETTECSETNKETGNLQMEQPNETAPTSTMTEETEDCVRINPNETPKKVPEASIDDSVLKVKTVQKIYPGPKAPTISTAVNVTPELHTHLARKSFTRKRANSEVSEKSALSTNDEEMVATEMAEPTATKNELKTELPNKTSPERAGDSIRTKAHELEIPQKIAEQSVDESGKPKTLEDPGSNEASLLYGNSTPKVAVHLTRRTYTRKQTISEKKEEERAAHLVTDKTQTAEKVSIPEDTLNIKQAEQPSSDSKNDTSLAGTSNLHKKSKSSRKILSDIDDVPPSISVSNDEEERSERRSTIAAKRTSKTAKSQSSDSQSVSSEKVARRTRNSSIDQSDGPGKESKNVADLDKSNQRSSKNANARAQSEPRKLGRPRRSASVDESIAPVPNRKSKRSVSVSEVEVFCPAAQGNLTVLETINEDSEASTSKGFTKVSSFIGDYTTSRRLTRRQAAMLSSISNMETLPEVDTIPVLDKKDVQEAAPQNQSPLSDDASVSRRNRSSSVATDVTGEVTTPKKRARRAATESPSTSGIKTRLRRPSADTLSVASEQSDVAERIGTVKGRKRGRSVSSTKSTASVDSMESSPKTPRGRRTVKKLSEIQEETASGEGTVSSTGRQLRKRNQT